MRTLAAAPSWATRRDAPVTDKGRTSSVGQLPRLVSSERSFLLELLRGAVSGGVLEFPTGARAGLVWEYAERHGLGGILGLAAESGRVEGLPGDVAEAAAARYWSQCLHGQHARERCRRVQRVAVAEGVRCFFVKGPVLATQGYGDDGLRGFSDLDLFVGSSAEGRRLVRALGCRSLAGSDQSGVLGSIWDSGRIVTDLDGWPLEIRYPIPGWSGPLFDFFAGDCWPEVVVGGDGVLAPPVPWHVLFLVHHLMMHHFFGRLVWFLDVAVLVRNERSGVDWREMVRGAERLGMSEALAAVARFCRCHIDPSFPGTEEPAAPRWNRAFIRRLTDPAVVVASPFHKQQASACGRVWAVLHGAASYHLLADAPLSGPLRDGYGWRWTEGRVRCVLVERWRGAAGRRAAAIVAALIAAGLHPLARVLAWGLTRRRFL